ncbi:SAVMC3_10250 family protein [Streptomyces sp. NPDC056222]|uniref:DUF7019 family protein n=1 Tax=Streptomyces sp. NPDC056222 TaxID=3345749 RepID=UPI0035D89A1A
MSVRYYLYVSDAKVDMLLSQIDPAWARKRVTEFGVDLKLATAKRSVEAAGTDRVARLERVVRHLEDHADLGDVDEPGQYVHGVLPMQWSVLGDDEAVYFGGRSDRTIVGLGGSTNHLLSTVTAAPLTQNRLSASLLPVLFEQLTTLAHESGTPAGSDTLATVMRANAALRGPAQTVEFLAKRLLHGPCPYPELAPRDDMTVLLASPLYVALVD